MRGYWCPAALGLFFACCLSNPAAAGNVVVHSYCTSGTAVGHASPPINPGTYRDEVAEVIADGAQHSPGFIPLSDAGDGSMSLVNATGQNDSYLHYVGARENGSGPGGFSWQGYAVSSTVDSQVIKFSFDWVPEPLVDDYGYPVLDEYGNPVPDPTDVAPENLTLLMEYTFIGGANAQGDFHSDSGGNQVYGSGYASATASVDGFSSTITASSTAPSPADFETIASTFQKFYSLPFSSGHYDLLLTASGSAAASGSAYATSYANMSLLMAASPAWLVSPNPRVDPVNPSATGAVVRNADPVPPGNNEYTFIQDPQDPTSTVVEVPCVAKTTSVDAANTFARSQAFIFEPENFNIKRSSGKTADGVLIKQSLFCGPLPEMNDTFGLAFGVHLKLNTQRQETAKVQFFFDRSGFKHPGPNNAVKLLETTYINGAGQQATMYHVQTNDSMDANWFYYWKQTGAAGGSPNDLFYETTGYLGNRERLGGLVPSMLFWEYWTRHSVDPQAPDYSNLISDWRGKIWIRGGAWLSLALTRGDGTNKTVTGIDAFAMIVQHERKHVLQMAQAEMIVPGWSFNVEFGDPRWNHDVNDTDLDDLPTQIDDRPDDAGYGLEEDAATAEKNPEDTYATYDWSAPGKRHGQAHDGDLTHHNSAND